MADGFRFGQHTAGGFYHPQPQHQIQSRHIVRNDSPNFNSRSLLLNEIPSPSRSPDSPAHNLYGMYGQSHNQGHGRVNPGPAARGGLPTMMYNFQHQNNQHAQQHTPLHQNLQQDHNAHSGNGNVLGHHANFSSGVLSNSTPNFTPNNLQNGHSASTRGGQAQMISEHWTEQLKLHKESERAHDAPHFYARMKAQENKGIASPVREPEVEGEDQQMRMSNSDTSSSRQDWHNLDLSGQGLRVLAPALFRYSFLTELYLSSNKLTRLPDSIGQLRQLTLLDVSNNELEEIPPEIGMCSALIQLLLFDNRIRELPNEVGLLSHLQMLGIEGNPNFDPALKTKIMAEGTKQLVLEMREKAPVPLPPPPRNTLELTDGMTRPEGEDTFKVFSHNILCPTSATPSQYGYTPSEALSWEHRREQVAMEIESQDADFVCLQELDYDSFHEFFSPRLAYHDWKGVYWPRTRSRMVSTKDLKTVDGCGIFYKHKKFILLDKQLIEYSSSAVGRTDMKDCDDIYNRVMNRDHIAIVAFLENRYTGSRLMIANTHLFYDTRYTDVKVIQTTVLMDSLGKWAAKYARWPAYTKDRKPYGASDDDGASSEPPPNIEAKSMEYSSATQVPLIICGDFNSTPGSGVHQLLSQGRIPSDHPDIVGFKYGAWVSNGIEHIFSLKSAYALLDGTPDEVKFTNYTPKFTGILDYIWYSSNALEVTSLLGPVDPTYLKRVPGFPNYHFPSDHLSLAAQFVMKGRKEKKVITEVDHGPSRDHRK